MNSKSPSPNSSPTVISPASDATSPPPSSSPSNTLITSPSPTLSQPNQTSDPPVPSTPSNTSVPAPQSPPPVPSSPPPSPPLSPPPPVAPAPTSPPPSPPTSPPTSPPPYPPSAPPPAVNLAPPPNLSPPPPAGGSPPPVSPEPPAAAPPPPSGIAPSPPPPPPVNVPTPPSSNSPPPPRAKSPRTSPPPPSPTPPPSSSQAAPPHSTNSPPTFKLSPPPPVPSSSSPTPASPPAPPTNSSATGTPTAPPLPSFPTEKPTAKTTNFGPNITANGTSTNNEGINTVGAVAIGIVVGFVVLSLLAMAVWFIQKRKKKGAGSNVGYNMPSPFASSQNSDSSFLRPNSSALQVGNACGSDFMYSSPPEASGIGNSRSWFTYEELGQATSGFSDQNLLGEGGFGCVYKGYLADGREVAVKQLKIGGGQGEREFRTEVEIISRVHHRHLVTLVGYCIAEHQRLLVYDYVPNNTLHYHLHGEGRPVMHWEIRLKVAAGAARGLAYLHEDCHPRIIHRDIKSSNILLDDNFEARVSDFGLAKLALDDACTHVTTRVMGTFGYMAPEYASSGKLTEKSDVYSYGVVLLELITGRKPVDASQPLGDESLVEWARPLLAQALENGDYEGLVDSRLEKKYVDIEMFRMIEAAAACVRHSAIKRPRMGQVVRAFDSIGEFSDLTNGVKPGQSGVFDSAQHSAQIRMFQRMGFGSQDYSSNFFIYSHSGSWRS